MSRLRRRGVWVSVAAASALLTAPVALADEGHGDHQDRGRDDEQAIVVQHETTTVSMERDNDVNETMNEDANEQPDDDRDELQVAPGQPQPGIDNDREVNDLNDDNN
jgi:hypothetical protein